MPHESKIDLELKIKACRNVIDGKSSIRETAHAVQVCTKTLREWMSSYRKEEIEGLISRTHCKGYPPNVKLSAVQDYLSGAMIMPQVCEKYGIGLCAEEVPCGPADSSR